MSTFTILRSSPKSLTSFKDMLDQKKFRDLDRMRPKMEVARFLIDFKPQFPKRDHKNSFCTENQQNSINNFLEDTN